MIILTGLCLQCPPDRLIFDDYSAIQLSIAETSWNSLISATVVEPTTIALIKLIHEVTTMLETSVAMGTRNVKQVRVPETWSWVY